MVVATLSVLASSGVAPDLRSETSYRRYLLLSSPWKKAAPANGRATAIADLVSRYNEIVDEVETDPRSENRAQTMTETAAQRSRIMRAVKSKDTAPELAVQRLAHALGYRHRLHARDLPGSPDLTFPRRKKVIFVHGCFWHGHRCERGDRTPHNNRAYWQRKIARNRARDRRCLKDLKAQGWRTLVVWECQIKATERLARRLGRFLDSPNP